jgi:hypothetical protein
VTVVGIVRVGTSIRVVVVRSRQTDSDPHQNEIKLTFDHFDISPILVRLLHQSCLIENEVYLIGGESGEKPHLTMTSHLYSWHLGASRVEDE